MTIEANFNAAVLKSKTLPNQPNEILLNLYGLYKQATVGDMSGKKPGMLDLVGKAKYEAWSSRKGMAKEAAMRAYVKMVEDIAASK